MRVALSLCLLLVHDMLSACAACTCRANNHRAEAMEEGTTDESDTRRDAPGCTDSRSGVQDAVEPGSEHGGKEMDLNVDSTPRPPPLGVPIVTTSRGEPTLSCVSDVVFEEQPKATGVSNLTDSCRCSGGTFGIRTLNAQYGDVLVHWECVYL